MRDVTVNIDLLLLLLDDLPEDAPDAVRDGLVGSLAGSGWSGWGGEEAGPLTLVRPGLGGGVGGEAETARDWGPAPGVVLSLEGGQALDWAELERSDAVQVTGREGQGELVWAEQEALAPGDGGGGGGEVGGAVREGGLLAPGPGGEEGVVRGELSPLVELGVLVVLGRRVRRLEMYPDVSVQV